MAIGRRKSKDDLELPDDCVGQDIRRAFASVKELCMHYGLPFRTLPTLTFFFFWNVPVVICMGDEAAVKLKEI